MLRALGTTYLSPVKYQEFKALLAASHFQAAVVIVTYIEARYG